MPNALTRLRDKPNPAKPDVNLLTILGSYLQRQGAQARAGADMANRGAAQIQGGDPFSGVPNLLAGGTSWLGSPVTAIMPDAAETYDLARNANASPELAAMVAGVAGVGGLALPGPKGAKASHAVEEGITAYHGSPHTFDKFDMSKIGTGEGAQAYGHGLYFAESPTVAGYYREGLTKQGVNVEYKGKPFQRREWERGQQYDGSPQAALESVQAYGGIDQAITEIEKGLKSIASRGGKFQDDPFVQAQKQRLDFLQANRNDIAVKPQGATYQVRLNVKPDELLDWDRPLSEQSKTVQDVVKQFPEEFRMLRDPTGAPAPQYGEPMGHEFYKKVAADIPQHPNFNTRNPTQATDRLKAAGIKGIRYKDAGSRSGEGGTYNYVIFDDSLINILKRYGIPLTVGAGGSAIVAGQNLPPEAAAQLGNTES